ncbi:hypothetical protein IWX49DRAFT_593719 [Phyllosticta citricarpa]|uniref:Arrestin C-terminal-like domain-containing protein n=2 Tax=Phyllosticta TaxID=121621 RepID=A0ABR1LNI4_9PEZI
MPTSTAQSPPSSSQTPAPGKSLLSRIKSPFASKARYIAEYYIKPDDPHRQYSPGDVVKGSVFLKVLKAIRVTHIVVSLHGYVQVYKNSNAAGEGYRAHYSSVASGKGSRLGGYFGNGFATLFEDEVVLCGEGRLGEGTYQFNFELEFPSKGLPSSIDFERGTVSYMLTSTMTRPTTIMPTATCDRKVYLIEAIDIAPLLQPKPRVVTLERVSRRSKTKSKSKKGVSSSGDQSTPQTTEQSRSSRVSELSSPADETEAPGSPAPSDTSFDSHFSSSNGGSSNASGPLSIRADTAKTASSSKAALHDPSPITATIELLKAGFLRGDSIPLKISVNHTKHVSSLRGIIVTLYRQARVDMHPAIPVVMNAKGENVSSEDYYPKSKTGLGGLSLSSAGSSHVFRKDLSQSFAPLIVDPRTRTAEVKASVRVPDEAFPTISCVPGAMISFRYYVEVVVDLQGKLSGLDKYFSNSGMMITLPTSYGPAPGPNGGPDGTGVFSAWGGHFLDTEPLRRDKGVVSCIFEIIVGTKDSDRRKGKGRAVFETDMEQNLQTSGSPHGQVGLEREQPFLAESGSGHDLRDYAYQSMEAPEYLEAPHPYAHPLYPVPDMVDEDNLPEKERLRRAEERLMPSAPPPPPPPADASTSTPGAFGPSAPILPDEVRPGLAIRLGTHAGSSTSGVSPSMPSAPPADDLGPRTAPPETYEPGIPNYEVASGSAANGHQPSPTDDKQELQRRRLEQERSAPETSSEGAPPTGSLPADVRTTAIFVPSAPVLSEEEYVFDTAHSADLPRYER